VRERPPDSGNRKRMVVHERGNYKKLEKRRAFAGLFIVFKTDEQDDYPCPRNTLDHESDGRSWAMNNTSNLPGVE
jgi:hypothetical protein